MPQPRDIDSLGKTVDAIEQQLGTLWRLYNAIVDANAAMAARVRHIENYPSPPAGDSSTATRLAAIELKLEALLTFVKAEGLSMNAQFSQLQALLDAMNGATNILSGNVDLVIASETAQLKLIEDLRAQVAAGKPVTQEQLDAAVLQAGGTVAALQTVSDHLKTIAADPANPVPVVEPAPEPPVAEV